MAGWGWLDSHGLGGRRPGGGWCGSNGGCGAGGAANKVFETSMTIFGVLEERGSSILLLIKDLSVVITTCLVSASRLLMASF